MRMSESYTLSGMTDHLFASAVVGNGLMNLSDRFGHLVLGGWRSEGGDVIVERLQAFL